MAPAQQSAAKRSEAAPNFSATKIHQNFGTNKKRGEINSKSSSNSTFTQIAAA